MRIEKVNSSIKRELGMMLELGEVNDPRISFVTIMNVDVSKDLQHARIKFSTLSDDPEAVKAAIEGFQCCRGYIRKLLSKRLALRIMPEFQFFYDKSVKYAAQVDEILEEIKKLQPAEGGEKDEGV